MFSESKSKQTVSTSGQPNRIGQKTKIKGEILSEGDFRIDGELNGDVKTSGKVVIGKEGYINGKVECANADIEGKFSGELTVINILSLKSGSSVEGNIVIGKLAVEPGASFNATCSMRNPSIKSLNNERPETEKAV
ncbi:polymer-forming cytoskeletal protein [Leptobacterium sp. I13]|uniref:bactofilin family protein n=1 Tax=Leptobacterium meishanense TaxID=3128904 RepID=UPI0030EB7CCE